MGATLSPAKPSTSEELDAVQRLLDSIPPTRCQYGRDRDETVGGSGPNCDEPATWLLVLSCGHDAPLCDEHMHKIERAIGRGFPLTCSRKETAGKAHPAGIRVTYEWRKL